MQTPYCYSGYSILSFTLFLTPFPTKIYTLKFVPATRPWKQVWSSWNLNTACQMASVRIPTFFGNLTYGQKIRTLPNFRPTPPSMRDTELSRCKCWDGESISLRQGVTLKHCSEAASAQPRASLQASPVSDGVSGWNTAARQSAHYRWVHCSRHWTSWHLGTALVYTVSATVDFTWNC